MTFIKGFYEYLNKLESNGKTLKDYGMQSPEVLRLQDLARLSEHDTEFLTDEEKAEKRAADKLFYRMKLKEKIKDETPEQKQLRLTKIKLRKKELALRRLEKELNEKLDKVAKNEKNS